MKHLCIFCGSRANSDEHVWPKWLARIMEQLPGTNKNLVAIRTNQHGERNRWERSTPELVTKSVCKVRCNEGWMSDLEKSVEPILRPMINGEEQTLTGEQQHIIAVWMLKGGMVLDSMSSQATFYEEAERFHFRTTLYPPGFLAFWLGLYSGSYWSGFTNHRIIRNEQSLPQYRSFVLTMVFGRLVLQLANTKVATSASAVNPPFRDGNWSTVELVPPFRHSIQWPPPGPSFDDCERKLLTFSERFGGTG
jgi:hypothetical protein